MFNVKDTIYAGGAKGDGATDDTAAIEAAWKAASSTYGGVLYFPRGNYVYKGVGLTTPPGTAGFAPNLLGDAVRGSTITLAGGGYELKLVSWGDGSGVIESGSSLVVVGIDDADKLHFRVFGPGPNASAMIDTDESQLPGQQSSIDILKAQISGLMPPHVLTDAEEAQVIARAISIVGISIGYQLTLQSPTSWLNGSGVPIAGTSQVIVGTDNGYDLRLISWGDGSTVPLSGKRLIFAGIDSSDLLHFRIFDVNGIRVVETDESKLPGQQSAIDTLKAQLPGLMPPHVLTDTERNSVIEQVASIVNNLVPSPDINNNSCLYIRIFDTSGNRIVDANETRLPDPAAISALKVQLPGLLPPHGLTTIETADILATVSRNVGLKLVGGGTFLNITRAIVGLSFKNLLVSYGKGAIYGTYTGTNVSGMYVVEDCRFENYTRTAIRSSAADMPYWKFNRCQFSGANYTSTMGIVLGGGTDSVEIANCAFLANRVSIKFARAANNCAIRLCDFIRFGPSTGDSRIDVWVVPRRNSDGQGGLSILESKFGNEGLDPGDYRIVYADEVQTTDPAPESTFPDLVHASTGFVVGHNVQDCAIFGAGADPTPMPLVYSTTSNVRSCTYGNLVTSGANPSYILQFLSGYDLRIVSWGDGTGVPTSGINLMIVGKDQDDKLHIRIFDARGVEVFDKDEDHITGQPTAIDDLKTLLSTFSDPDDLTLAQKSQVIGAIASIAQIFSDFLVQIQSWTHPSCVPNAGNKKIFIGEDADNKLHIRIFDADSRRITNTDESQLPDQAAAIATLKGQLSTLSDPNNPTSNEVNELIESVTSIVGPTLTASPIISSANTNNVIGPITGEYLGLFNPVSPSSNGYGTYQTIDPIGYFGASSREYLPWSGGADQAGYTRLLSTKVQQWSHFNGNSNSTTVVTDAIGGTDAAEFIIVDNGLSYANLMMDAISVGEPTWIEFDGKRGSTSLPAVMRAVVQDGTSGETVHWQRAIELGADWSRYRFRWVPRRKDATIVLGVKVSTAGAVGRIQIGRVKVYHGREPVLADVVTGNSVLSRAENSTQANPTFFGVRLLPSNGALRFGTGAVDGMQSSPGYRMSLASYWGLELRGKQGPLHPSTAPFNAGTISDPCVSIYDANSVARYVFDSKGHAATLGPNPTISAGPGAGTTEGSFSVSIAISGTDHHGKITLTTGKSPGVSATVATISFGATWDAAPRSVTLSPGNENALGAVPSVYVDSLGAVSWLMKSGASGLPEGKSFIWYYSVGG